MHIYTGLLAHTCGGLFLHAHMYVSLLTQNVTERDVYIYTYIYMHTCVFIMCVNKDT